MTRKTALDYENDLIELEARIRKSADQTMASPDLTPEGKASHHAGWVKERQWREQYAEAASGLLRALESAGARATEARQKLTAMPTGEAALAAEMRHARRAKRVEAALASGGTGPLSQLIAEADDSELAVLLEHASDHFEAAGGQTAKAGAEMIEDALRDKFPEYGMAAKVAGASGAAASIARQRIAHVEALLDDPSTREPSRHDQSRMSITVAGDEVGDLEG